MIKILKRFCLMKYTILFEKNKNLDPYQRSCLQLVSPIKSNEEKDMTNNFSYSSKTHSTLEDNKFIPLYADHLYFLIKRAGWQVTKIYGHYTFEQAKFKKTCVTVMNQKSRQEANSLVEKDFFKLLNNSNFRIDCRNNIDKFTIEPLYDDIGEIAYIKKFTSIYNNDDFKDFFSPQHMKGEVIQLFQNKIMHLDKNNSTYEARKQYLNNKMVEELDAVESFENAKNKNSTRLTKKLETV